MSDTTAPARHTAYALHADGTAHRHPFANFPTDAAIRWVVAHPAERVRFVPALPVFSGMTGHWSDCPTYDTLDASDCACWERPRPRLDRNAPGWEWSE